MSRKIKIVLNKTNNIILLYFNTMFTKYEFINLKMYYYWILILYFQTKLYILET